MTKDVKNLSDKLDKLQNQLNISDKKVRICEDYLIKVFIEAQKISPDFESKFSKILIEFTEEVDIIWSCKDSSTLDEKLQKIYSKRLNIS